MKKIALILAIFIFTANLFSQDGALEFDHTKEHHVNHGHFWKTGMEHGVFFWEAWVKPYPNAQYVISDGYGGQHALLFGFLGGSKFTKLGGNIFDATTNLATSFGSNEAIPVNQWCHIAVGWDRKNIVTYLNGAPIGIVPYSGKRITVNGSGAGVLFIGGSDHSNFSGKIARVRGFEGALPLENLLTAFRPELYFGTSYVNSLNESVPASFLADYDRPAKVYQDLAIGYMGAKHVGILGNGVDAGIFAGKTPTGRDLPRWTPETITQPERVNIKVPDPPNNAIVFDSFNRSNKNPAFDSHLGLGSPDVGIAADARWMGRYADKWGILNGRAYAASALAWPIYLETDTANMDVRIQRTIEPYSTGKIALVYRYVDDLNYGFVFSLNNIIYLVEQVDGAYALSLAGVEPNQSWSVLRVTAKNSEIKVFCDESQIISSKSPNLSGGTKAGLIGSTYGMERFDNFTVFPAP